MNLIKIKRTIDQVVKKIRNNLFNPHCLLNLFYFLNYSF